MAAAEAAAEVPEKDPTPTAWMLDVKISIGYVGIKLKAHRHESN